MRMTFRVKYEDERELVTVAKPKDIVAFERQYGVAFTALAEGTGQRMEWLFYLAWSPLHRSGKEPRAFDEFLDSVDEVEAVDEVKPEAGTAPFPQAVSPSSSPGSPSEAASLRAS